MNDDHVKIRKLNAEDALKGLRLSEQAGWNQTISEWNLILSDPSSLCLGAVLDDQVIATAASINYSAHFSWIAMVLTDINYRKQGISKLVLSTLLESLGDHRIIKLDATPMGQILYSQLGFVSEYRILRFVLSSFTSYFNLNKNISTASAQEYEFISLWDQSGFESDRTLLFNWLQINFSHLTLLVKSNEKINGFICGREGRNYTHLGPLMCSDTSHAIALLENALSKIKNMPVIVDVPESKGELIHWLESKGFTKQREFIRMYKNKNVTPALLQDQYLIAGPEFG